MSVNHEAFLGIGKRFSSNNDVASFLLDCSRLSSSQIVDLLDEWHAAGTDIIVRCLDAWNGDDWFVGFKVACGESAEGLQENVAEAAEAWAVMFPSQQARVVLASIVS